VKLPYGDDEIQFEIDQSRLIDKLVPRETPAAKSPYDSTRMALNHPVDGNGLHAFARKGYTVIIIVDDYTRPTSAGPICQAILDELNSQGIDDSHVTLITASGLHRPMNEAELRVKLGPDVMHRVEVNCHDAWDDNKNEHVGQTSNGTPVWINKRVLKADLRITVGMVAAHFTAGYGSGPKTILPGVSGYRTIHYNHGVLSLAPSARIGLTEGNPCWEDMVDALKWLGPTLAVDVVLNAQNELVAAFHGKPVAENNVSSYQFISG
jgi:nickel-dependent lactate racemase